MGVIIIYKRYISQRYARHEVSKFETGRRKMIICELRSLKY